MNIFGYQVKVAKSSSSKKRVAVDFFAPKKDRLVFSQSDLLDVQKMITDRLEKVEFSAKIDFLATKNIFDFLNSNKLQIVRRIFFDGYVVINTQTMEFVDMSARNFTKTYDGKMYFELFEGEIIYTSETFEACGKTDYEFLKDKLLFLDTVNSSDFNLIENYGAMGIISPETDNSGMAATFDDPEIEAMQKKYQESYGVKFGKWHLWFVPKPTRYSKIDLPIAQLQLSDKRLYCLRALYSAFGIPKELSVYFDNSKYANLNEAEVMIYTSVITKWANVMLDIANKIYSELRKTQPFLMANDFWFDFVGVLALQEKQKQEKENAKLDFEFWQKIKMTYPEHTETANSRIETLIENL